MSKVIELETKTVYEVCNKVSSYLCETREVADQMMRSMASPSNGLHIEERTMLVPKLR